MNTGTYTGIVDRVVDGETAVVLLETDGEVTEQLDVPVDQLPPDCRREGAMLELRLEDDDIADMTSLTERSAERHERVQDRLDRLSERLSDQER